MLMSNRNENEYRFQYEKKWDSAVQCTVKRHGKKPKKNQKKTKQTTTFDISETTVHYSKNSKCSFTTLMKDKLVVAVS